MYFGFLRDIKIQEYSFKDQVETQYFASLSVNINVFKTGN